MAKRPKPEGEQIGLVTPFGLRLLPDLRARLDEACRQSGRSLNSEITYRLTRSFAIEDANARAREEWLAGRDPQGDVPPPESIGDYGVPAVQSDRKPIPRNIQELQAALVEAHARAVEEVMNRFGIPSASDPNFPYQEHLEDTKRGARRRAPDVPPANTPAKRKSRKP